VPGLRLDLRRHQNLSQTNPSPPSVADGPHVPGDLTRYPSYLHEFVAPVAGAVYSSYDYLFWKLVLYLFQRKLQ